MKCPIDQTEMKKGELAGFAKSIRIRKASKFLSLYVSSLLDAYYCPKCGKVELATEPDKEDK